MLVLRGALELISYVFKSPVQNPKIFSFHIKKTYIKAGVQQPSLLACCMNVALLLCLSSFWILAFPPSEILWKLLAVLDSSLSVLCSEFIREESREAAQCWMELTHSRLSGTTFCLLLDLLEVLTASSSIRGADGCLKSQRLTHIHSSALLTTISGSSQYFVKKRVLLLLKKAVLQKAGEDWALGEARLPGPKHDCFNSDMSLLSRSVLTAVAADWLQSVQVESASFFGGTRQIGADEGRKPDCVMLSGVSLLLLKSMELHIQTAGGTGETPGWLYIPDTRTE